MLFNMTDTLDFKQILHEAAEDLFSVIINFGACKTDARAIKSSPGTPFQLKKLCFGQR